MNPLVTILIPTYNRAEYLRLAIQSALAQAYPHVEIIVLDDASPDHTLAVAAEFADVPHLRVIRHLSNVGIVNNWKAGIEAATGEFFCLLHDDDTFEPEFVETLLRPLVADESLLLSFCDHWVMDSEGQRLPDKSEDVSRRFKRHLFETGRLENFLRAALIDMAVPVGASLFRKRMISTSFLNDRAQGSIDAWLFYQCVKTGYGASYVSERLMNYREHSEGMSASRPLYMAEGHLFRYREILNDTAVAAYHPAVRQLMAEALTSYGINLAAGQRHAEARTALAEALHLQPNRRAIVAYLLACGGRLGTGAIAALRGSR